jgi:cyclic pyranopterin phosphate synthase
MVDVTGKATTVRRAVARAKVHTTADVVEELSGRPGEADPIVGARMAAIGAAKRAWDLIPLCHPIHVSGVSVVIVPGDGVVEIEAVTEVVERTGVEMEALTACAVAGLAIVGALRDVDPWASIDDLALWSKEGGRSGRWTRDGG